MSEGHTLGNIVITTVTNNDGFSAIEVTGGTISGSSGSWTITPTSDTVSFTLPSTISNGEGGTTNATNTYITELLVYYA